MNGEPDVTQDVRGDVIETPTPGRKTGPDRGRIVVGVDDSEQAAAALCWAMAEGALRGLTVEAVHTWQPPLAALPFGATLVMPVGEAAIDAEARNQIEQTVSAAIADIEGPAPQVQITILHGIPALTLVEASQDAELLVVGSHGRTGWSRLVLGSVAMACVQHAHCPVVVIRGSQTT
jgi:nucleotide-binding universal stress UspA family protein